MCISLVYIHTTCVRSGVLCPTVWNTLQYTAHVPVTRDRVTGSVLLMFVPYLEFKNRRPKMVPGITARIDLYLNVPRHSWDDNIDMWLGEVRLG